MKKFVAPLLMAAALGGAACTPQDGANLGLLAGAGGGLLLADAFNANAGWTIAAAVGGAAIGQQVGRQAGTNNCAYYAGTNQFGQPVYRQGPC